LSSERLDAHPSYFETVTAMALLAFRDRCDISVMEVGLGGRLDATNVIAPELCVITPVSYDHEAFLGNTIEAIAYEKAGILKPGVPAIVANQPAPADSVISKRARELNCEVIRTSEVQITDLRVTPRNSTFCVDGTTYRCGLAGRHQLENAIAAMLTCRQLDIPESAIQAGLSGVQWPGRLEFVSANPDFVLDGAHNPAGAAALAAYIREFHANRPVWIVYGGMHDKAVEEVTAHLFPLADFLILTAPKSSRALRPEAVLALSSRSNTAIAPAIQEAIEIARTAPPEAIVFFTGSLFLVGEARGLLASKRQLVS
jgi:dihydrofolate synthase / folylpolyglutamate synthase